MWIENAPSVFSSSDARRLLSLPRGEGYFDGEYTVKPWDTTIIPESGLTPVWDFIDVYTTELRTLSDPREKTLQRMGRSVILKPMAEDEYHRIRTLLFQYISRQPWFDASKVTTLKVSKNGILEVQQNDGKTLSIDIISGWNIMRLPPDKLSALEKKVRQEQEELKESLNTEAFFWGSLIVTYAPSVVFWLSWASLGYSAITRSREIIQKIKKITLKMNDGSFQTIETDGAWDTEWTKDQVRDTVLKSLAKRWIIYDVVRRVWYEPSWNAFQEARSTIRGMSYTEYVKTNTEPLSQTEFQKMKDSLLAEADTLNNEYIKQLKEGKIGFQWKAKDFLKKILSLGTLQHLFFWAIFFSKFAKYQDWLNFWAGVSETILFMTGDKMGKALTKPLSALGIGGKVANFSAGIIGWGMAVYYGHEAWEKILDGKKKYWKYASRKWMWVYTDGSSKTLNFAFGGWITWQLDDSNDRLKRNGHGEKTFDIGSRRIEHLPFKRFGINHRMPEMTWFQHNINLWTAPWDWVRENPGRTIDGWNSQLETYKKKLALSVSQAIGYYQSGQWPFMYPEIIKEHGSKEKVLEWYLYELLMAWGTSDAFGKMRKDIVDACLEEVKKWWSKKSEENLSFFIGQQVSFLQIDEDFIQTRMLEWDIKKQQIQWSILALSPYVWREQIQYLLSLLDRMITNKEVVTLSWGKWIEIEVLGTKGKKFIPSDEVRWFDGVLDDNRMMVNLPEKMKVWSYFVLLLDKMLELKREHEFLTEIKKWNRKWVVWAR